MELRRDGDKVDAATPNPMKEVNGVWHEDPVHGWFGLSYAAWLTLPRVLMEDMPLEWQTKMVALLEEIDETFPNAEIGVTRVHATEHGKLVKMPEWLKNYRHPDREAIQRCRMKPMETK